ncbi:MAG: hypothetical protein FWD31_06090 [Planctomycetaceae bacterium]|nr:hypothetical protein [Planctomycetaceae bacterium]
MSFRPSALSSLLVADDDTQSSSHVAGFPTELAQNRERVFEQKLRRIPLGLSQQGCSKNGGKSLASCDDRKVW